MKLRQLVFGIATFIPGVNRWDAKGDRRNKLRQILLFLSG